MRCFARRGSKAVRVEFLGQGDVVVHIFRELFTVQGNDIFICHGLFKVAAEEQDVVKIRELVAVCRAGACCAHLSSSTSRWLTYIDTPYRN